MIRDNPKAVARVAKVPIDLVLNLQRIWIEASELNAAMTYLAAFGLTHFQVTTLVGKFGNHVVPMLREDPYLLISEVPGFGFKRVDKIARRLGTPKELPSRLRAGIHTRSRPPLTTATAGLSMRICLTAPTRCWFWTISIAAS